MEKSQLPLSVGHLQQAHTVGLAQLEEAMLRSTHLRSMKDGLCRRVSDPDYNSTFTGNSDSENMVEHKVDDGNVVGFGRETYLR